MRDFTKRVALFFHEYGKTVIHQHHCRRPCHTSFSFANVALDRAFHYPDRMAYGYEKIRSGQDSGVYANNTVWSALPPGN